MAGVEEIRAQIAAAAEKAQSGIASVQNAVQQLEEAQNLLMSATQGSSQPDAAQANAMISGAMQSLLDVQAAIQAGVNTAESYAARL